jgi:hypothetical protein
VLVMKARCRHDGAVRQPGVLVDADVQLHAEVPLLAFGGRSRLRALALTISGSRVLRTLLGEIVAAIVMAPTMLPVPAFSPLACKTSPTLANSA